jgi:uncharacterized membrane protein YqiK
MESTQNKKSNGAGFGIFAIFVGLLLLVGPIIIAKFVSIDTVAKIILMLFGVVMLLIGLIVYIIAQLYRKTPANESYVRTGMGGKKVIMDGGTIVIPMVHDILIVSLETMKLTVERTGKIALITKDDLRADVTTEFFINVAKNETDILAAATSLGERSTNPDNVMKLVEEKLVSALRTVASGMDLQELHSKRDTFASGVQEIVAKDLKTNGLTLEAVTVSKLDQTPLHDLQADSNMFDARGARTIAEIVSKAKIERNAVTREAEQKVKQQDVETQKFVYEREVEQEVARTGADKQKQNAQSQNEAEANKFKAEQLKIAGQAQILTDQELGKLEVEKTKVIQSAEVEREKVVELAKTEKTKAVEVANQQKEEAIKTAEVDKDIAVVKKNEQKAAADEKKNTAVAGAEKALQSVETVKVTETANRLKSKAIIDQEAEAETQKIKENMQADIQAYNVTKKAEAEKLAAENEAAATVTKATASKDAMKAEAEGKTAVEMVPVEVDKARVIVEASRVTVLKSELEAKASFDKVSITLEISKKELDVQQAIGVAQAEALGTALGTANMNIWGTGQTFETIANSFFKGQAKAKFFAGLGSEKNTKVNPERLIAAYLEGQLKAEELQGLITNTPQELKDFVKGFVSSEGGQAAAGLAALIMHVTGQKATDDQIEKLKAFLPDADQK